MNPEEDPKKTPGIVEMFKNIPKLDINPILPEVVSSAQPIQGIYENIRVFAGSPFPLENTPGFQMFLRKVSESHDDALIGGISIPPPHEFHERALAERVKGDDKLMGLLTSTYLQSVEEGLSNNDISFEEYEDVRCRVGVYSALTKFFQNRIDELADLGYLRESFEVEINWKYKQGQDILQVYKGIYTRSKSCLDTLRLISNEDLLKPEQIEELDQVISELNSFGRVWKEQFNMLFIWF